jgi:hypothetical protein
MRSSCIKTVQQLYQKRTHSYVSFPYPVANHDFIKRHKISLEIEQVVHKTSFIKTSVMKSLLVIIAGFLSLSVIAQKKNVSINHYINDDGKTLSIKIKGTINDKPVDYSRTFDVSGMTKEQRDAIKRNVYDSLGLPDPVAPRAPLKPLTPLAPQVVVEPVAPLEPIAPVTPPTISLKSQYTETYTIGGDHPYTKEIKYNPKTGLLYMKYRFIKNGEETSVEKSVDAKDKSKEERDQIIKKYEKEIGMLPPEIV